MSPVEAPNFAVLLGPWIADIPNEAVPRFLALLERGAAERYRGWADQLPELAEGLLECAELGGHLSLEPRDRPLEEVPLALVRPNQ